jgi:hypothetical protein
MFIGLLSQVIITYRAATTAAVSTAKYALHTSTINLCITTLCQYSAPVDDMAQALRSWEIGNAALAAVQVATFVLAPAHPLLIRWHYNLIHLVSNKVSHVHCYPSRVVCQQVSEVYISPPATTVHHLQGL